MRQRHTTVATECSVDTGGSELDVYRDLGVRTVLNAAGRFTVLGGSVMPPPVVQAMSAASRSHVNVVELQAAVGRRLAELTRNEDAYVTTGAAAGLILSVLACMTGGQETSVARLPDTTGLARRVVAFRSQHVPYTVAVEFAGAQLVEIGNAIHTRPAELAAELEAGAVAVLYVAGRHLRSAALSLEETVAIAHRHGVPVIVDAAAQLPPTSNLWALTRDAGADIAVFSGGKDLRGPASSGLVVGRGELIKAMRTLGFPHQWMPRALKVGKEEMVGLLAAVEEYLAEDQDKRNRRFTEIVTDWHRQLADMAGVEAEVSPWNQAGQPIPRLLLDVDADVAGITAGQLQDKLSAGDPSVAVGAHGPDGLYLTPDSLCEGEELMVAERLIAMLEEATA